MRRADARRTTGERTRSPVHTVSYEIVSAQTDTLQDMPRTTRQRRADTGAGAKAPSSPPGLPLPLDQLCFLLARANHSLVSEIAAGLEEIGLSARGHEVLVTAVTGQYTQIELARLIGFDKSTMVVTLDELEAAGLVERRPAPGDRRARVIVVTRAGERKALEGDAIIHRVHEDVLSVLPADERAAFLAALRRLVAGRLASPAATPSQPVRRRRSPR